MQVSTKLKIYVVFAAAAVSVAGDLLIHTVVFRPPPEAHIPLVELDPFRLFLDFVSGLITGVIFASIYLRSVRYSIEKGESWIRRSIRIGAFAGYANAMILGAISLGVFAHSGEETKRWLSEMLTLFAHHFPFVAILYGVPAAAMGAMAGLGGGFVLKRLAFRERRSDTV